MDFELAIIGAGPAGYSAGIYAARAGIKSVIFDVGAGGGIANLSPNIENFVGFESISGPDLMDKMKKHAEKYVDIKFFEEIIKIEKSSDNFNIMTPKNKYKVGAIILSTGTIHNKLNVKGEDKLQGKGVSYCATCDGFFFKNKIVAVIGGGNSALIEALFLKQIGCKTVYIIHRRDQLRAEKAYEDEVFSNKIEILFNTNVISINGNDKVENLSLINTINNNKTELVVDGVFISIGENPQNNLAKQLKVNLDNNGFIITDKEQRTNVKGVYAAGDITGGLRQIITACSEGAIAALSSTEKLGKKYPY